MKIGIGSDHAGFRYKERIREWLSSEGHEVRDFGTDSETPVDYPVFIRPVAEAVASGAVERGIVLGGSGNGEAMAANRVPGARCALCWDVASARLARAHNDANMLSMGQRMLPIEMAIQIVRAWMTTPFDGGRHERRVRMLGSLLWAAGVSMALLCGGLSPCAAADGEPARTFQERLGALSAGDVVGHLALARWCRGQGLDRERERLLLHVLSIDPAQEEAYRELGYILRDGLWISRSDERREIGWVLYKGKWLAPGEYRPLRIADWLADLSGRDAEASRAARSGLLAFVAEEDLPVLEDALRKRHPRAAREAVLVALLNLDASAQSLAEKLADPKDPDAGILIGLLDADGQRPSGALLAALAGSLKPYLSLKVKLPEERLEAFVRLAGKSATPESAQFLYRLAIQDRYSKVRRAAGEILGLRKDPEVLDAAAKLLSAGSGLLRERASALAVHLADPKLLPLLVDSLERTLAARERSRLAQEPDRPLGMFGSGSILGEGAGRSPFGLNDFLLDTGDSAPVFTFSETAAEATALERITGQPYGEDARAWRRWLASQKQ